jgi:hypothetical protein
MVLGVPHSQCLEVLMYSPSIDPGLIPVLYRMGKARGIPMTRLVDRLLFDALEGTDLPSEAIAFFEQVAARYRNPTIQKEAA